MERIKKEFFVDRAGKPHYLKNMNELDCDCCIHHEIASKLLPDEKYPKDVLMKKGWVCVGDNGYSGAAVCYKEPTQAQINKVDLLICKDILVINK